MDPPPNDNGHAAMEWNSAIYQPLLGTRVAKDLSLDIRLGFIRKVYGILLLMLLLTIGVGVLLKSYLDSKQNQPNFEILWVANNEWMFFVALIVMVTCMCVIACAEHQIRRFPNNYILLFLFSSSMGVLVGFATLFTSWETVLLAFGVTVGIVLFLTAFSCIADTDFVGYAPYAMVGMMVLLLFGAVLVSMEALGVNVNMLYLLYSFLATLLFAFLIVFDTQLILGERGGHKVHFSVDDYAFAALTLYTDIINLFLAVLNLCGSREAM